MLIHTSVFLVAYYKYHMHLYSEKNWYRKYKLKIKKLETWIKVWQNQNKSMICV
jgi:hypothetical protein